LTKSRFQIHFKNEQFKKQHILLVTGTNEVRKSSTLIGGSALVQSKTERIPQQTDAGLVFGAGRLEKTK
jgi:hypothetical protein